MGLIRLCVETLCFSIRLEYVRFVRVRVRVCVCMYVRRRIQSNPQAMHNHCIKDACFLIGGDLNTRPRLMSQLLVHMERKANRLRVHGNRCIAGGMMVETLRTSAWEHGQGKHRPYGICWSPPSQRKRAAAQPLNRSDQRATKIRKQALPSSSAPPEQVSTAKAASALVSVATPAIMASPLSQHALPKALQSQHALQEPALEPKARPRAKERSRATVAVASTV